MAYPTDIFTDCEGLFYCLADWSNRVTEGYFFTIIILALGIVILMGSINFGFARAFGYATISCALMGLILVQMSLIPTYILTISLVLSGVGIAIMFMDKKG